MTAAALATVAMAPDPNTLLDVRGEMTQLAIRGFFADRGETILLHFRATEVCNVALFRVDGGPSDAGDTVYLLWEEVQALDVYVRIDESHDAWNLRVDRADFGTSVFPYEMSVERVGEAAISPHAALGIALQTSATIIAASAAIWAARAWRKPAQEPEAISQ